MAKAKPMNGRVKGKCARVSWGEKSFIECSKRSGGRRSAIPELREPPMARVAYDERWIKKEIDLLELVTLRESGLTLREIASRLGISKSRLFRAIYPATRGNRGKYAGSRR